MPEVLALAIRYHQKYVYNTYQTQALSHLETSLGNLTASRTLPHGLALSLSHLLDNLKSIDAQLSSLEAERGTNEQTPQDSVLADDKITGFKDIKARFVQHLTPQSTLFRHAVRMSLVLCVGYAIIQFAHLENGYWIMLTSLFVCQPNYNATKTRLTLRVVGTLAGILIGLPILYFVPSQEGQLILIVISGVLFFLFRNVRYAYATMFITLLVLFCFNLLGEGFQVAIPRIVDTLIGCAIAQPLLALFGQTGSFAISLQCWKKRLTPTAAILMPYWSSTTAARATALITVLFAVTLITAMPSWLLWCLAWLQNRSAITF